MEDLHRFNPYKTPNTEKEKQKKSITPNEEVICNWYLMEKKISFSLMHCHWTYQIHTRVNTMPRNSWPTTKQQAYVCMFLFCFIILCIIGFCLIGILFGRIFWKRQRTWICVCREVGGANLEGAGRLKRVWSNHMACKTILKKKELQANEIHLTLL